MPSDWPWPSIKHPLNQRSRSSIDTHQVELCLSQDCQGRPAAHPDTAGAAIEELQRLQPGTAMREVDDGGATCCYGDGRAGEGGE